MSSVATEYGYLPVATATLVPCEILDCDLFVERSAPLRMELYRGREYPLTQDDVARLHETGVGQVFIRLGDAEAYRQYLCDKVLHDAGIEPSQRLTALREATRVGFENALNASNCAALIGIAVDFGEALAELVSSRGVVFGDMFALLEHDYYTFTHVCNVSTYCVLLAQDLGLSDVETMSEIAAGGLLHDIGKRHVPARILNKPSKPTEAEWTLIRRHPLTGYQELAGRDDVTWGQLMMVYQHHERFDGSGYPAGIEQGEMHPWGANLAVADVFDALTCQRPYRRALPVPDVCKYLQEHAGTWFDDRTVNSLSAQLRLHA